MKTEKVDNGVLEHWSPEDVKAAFDRNEIVLIDVRTPQEFSLERINGALLAPMQSFEPSHMPSQSEKQIVFHCGSGVRSSKVAVKYLNAGNERIAHMEGGFGAWKKSGLEYTGTDVSTGAPKSMKDSAN
ncbi:rhodanese-related sulfurtransferase [Loktanella ponticola]|uniref:Rhodanese-related sulfurtransferase n=1 Tax=Yoonia ponticola TaxID=1524255 RepID=A0A7W9BNL1_9RHOB|nr:rhodanese-like domain-containing protein [Yoonia ponticola]MBB5723823.1 rhodanese-related sulfurtransferase [Yoonia ponticola]